MEKDRVVECVRELVTTILRKDTSQHGAVMGRYCREDMLLRHPLFELRGREALVSLFEGWSAYNRRISCTINEVVYDEAQDLVMVDLTQHLVFPLLPVAQADFQMWVKFTLRDTDDGRYLVLRMPHIPPSILCHSSKLGHRKVIVRQEDIYTARGIFRMWLPGRLIHEYVILPLGNVPHCAAIIITWLITAPSQVRLRPRSSLHRSPRGPAAGGSSGSDWGTSDQPFCRSPKPFSFVI
jgi:hypothetical protein